MLFATFSRHRITTLITASLFIGLFPAIAPATVSLTLTPTPGPGTLVIVQAGGSFSLSVKLFSSSSAAADQAASVTYSLQSSISNVFTIAGRDTTTVSSSFPSTTATDATVASSPIGTTYGVDESATTSDQRFAVSNGTYEVANYLISVASGASAGTFTVSTASPSGAGYQGPVTDPFNPPPDMPFSSQGSVTVDVLPAVPESSTAALLAAIAASILLRRRRLSPVELRRSRR